MKKHLKRQSAPKTWPIAKKGTKFLVKASSKGIPLLMIFRDMLKLAKTKKEVKRALHENKILVCGKIARDYRKSVELLDTITIVPSGQSYILTLSEKGKFKIEETKDKSSKISKIIDKKALKGKKTQINLSDGRNYIYDEKCKVNDSVLINFEKNKIEKILPLVEKSNVIIVGGKHTGKKGKINKMIPERKMAEVSVDKEKFNVLIKQLMVIQ